MVPEAGPLAAVGFIVEAVSISALLVHGSLAGVAAVWQLAVAFRQAAIAKDRICFSRDAITDGKSCVGLRMTSSEIGKCREMLQSGLAL